MLFINSNEQSSDCKSSVDITCALHLVSSLLPGPWTVINVMNHVVNHSLAKRPHICHYSSVWGTKTPGWLPIQIRLHSLR